MRISSLKGAIKRRLRRMSNAQALQEDAETFGDVIVDGKGHREYVGGLWHAIGARQFRFMVDEGLEPHHVLLDVACGSLRAGVRFIPYLQPGNYLGIEIRRELIEAGSRAKLARNFTISKNRNLSYLAPLNSVVSQNSRTSLWRSPFSPI